MSPEQITELKLRRQISVCGKNKLLVVRQGTYTSQCATDKLGRVANSFMKLFKSLSF